MPAKRKMIWLHIGTYKRLEAAAEGFDTPNSVVARLLDAHDAATRQLEDATESPEPPTEVPDE